MQMIRQLRLAVVATCHTALKPREAGRSEGGKGQAGAESDPQSQFWGKREFLPRAWLVSGMRADPISRTGIHTICTHASVLLCTCAYSTSPCRLPCCS